MYLFIDHWPLLLNVIISKKPFHVVQNNKSWTVVKQSRPLVANCFIEGFQQVAVLHNKSILDRSFAHIHLQQIWNNVVHVQTKKQKTDTSWSQTKIIQGSWKWLTNAKSDLLIDVQILAAKYDSNRS